MDDILHFGINDAQINQRHGQSRLGAQHGLLFGRQFQILQSKVSQRQHGTGFRHPKTGEDINPLL